MLRISRLIFAAFFFVLLPLLPSAFAAPRAAIENPLFDAGDIPQGKKISHDFFLKNTGDKELTFKITPC